MPTLEHRLAAILAADVAGYTRLMERDTDATVVAWTAARDQVIEPALRERAGRIVKFTGDGFLAEFPSIQEAVLCAVDLQRRLASSPLDFRMGIHLGDIVDDGRDIHGEGVNIAARIEALAPPGGINISGSVYEQVRNRIDVHYEDRGEHTVKHVSAPIRVYGVGEDTSPEGGKSAPAQEAAGVEQAMDAERASIAVLPFDNLSSDPEQEYFVDGLTADIITDLSRIPDLLVIARGSTFTYKGRSVPAQTVCRELGVGHVLEGSVRRAGQRVRVNAQLIDGRSGAQVWAQRFDRAIEDVFDVQDELNRQIVAALEMELVRATRPGAPGPEATGPDTTSPEAYDTFLRGRQLYQLFTAEGNLAARSAFEAAIAIDPAYAAAHAGLALTYQHEWFAGAKGALEQGYRCALEAQRHGPDLPFTLEAIGNVQLFRRQHDEAVAAARRWLAIEPNSADAHANLAGTLNFSGEPGRVEASVDRAVRLNPFYPFYYSLYRGQARVAMGSYEAALEPLRRSIAQNPYALPSHVYLAAALGHLGRLEEAKAAMDRARSIHPDLGIEWARTYFPYRTEEHYGHLLDGLRIAGV